MADENRVVSVARQTSETNIKLELNLDGTGVSSIKTGVGFFDHMLTHVAKHGLFDLRVTSAGDLKVDDHHTIEDVGILLGRAILKALGNKEGINRFGHSWVPMDEALVVCAIDISGRGLSVCNLPVSVPNLGEMSTEMVPEFFRALADNAEITVHVHREAGRNAHHIVEAAFKAFGRALSQAVALNDRVKGVPSTKGSLGVKEE